MTTPPTKTSLLVCLLFTCLPLQSQAGDVPLMPPPKSEDEKPVARVVLDFIVGEDGHPQSIKVVSSTDPDLDAHAMGVASKWKLAEKAVGKHIQAPIEYNQAMVDKIKAAKKADEKAKG